MPERRVRTGDVRLADLLAGLSVAADLGYGLEPGDALRSCVVATRLARTLNLPDSEVAAVFYTSLLQHIGCTAPAHEAARVFADELAMNAAAARANLADPREFFSVFLPELTRDLRGVDRARVVTFAVTRGKAFARQSATATCEVARATARRLGLPAEVQDGLYRVFEWFGGKGAPDGLRGQQIPLPARIAVAASTAAFFDHLGGAGLAADAVRARAGAVLDPAVVAAFVDHGKELLDELNAADPRVAILDLEPTPVRVVSAAELEEIAVAFADVADLKSPYLHGHSRRVAELAGDAVARLGLAQVTVAGVRLAGLLHDLGRVSVSDAIWEKPGTLTSLEWEKVRLHAYHSERILAGSAALAPWAALAGMHHERLDGSGYHRALAGHVIPEAARTLAAADVYVALTEDRPHRRRLDPLAAAEELRAEARRGRLEPAAVEAVLASAGHTTRKRHPHPAELTEREVEVLRLVAQGLSNRDVATRLVISARTAEHHIQHIYAKIGVSSRAAAALFALEHGLLG